MKVGGGFYVLFVVCGWAMAVGQQIVIKAVTVSVLALDAIGNFSYSLSQCLYWILETLRLYK